jgi:hypothetical protein
MAAVKVRRSTRTVQAKALEQELRLARDTITLLRNDSRG